MKVKVTQRGLLIPKELLEGVRSVEIRRENNQIILTPIVEDDPIWGLGSDPIRLGIADAAENHDRYLYGSMQLNYEEKSYDPRTSHLRTGTIAVT